MKTRGHYIFARLFKKEGVRGLLAAALFAAPLCAAAPARAENWYPGNGAAMSAESPNLFLPSAELLAQCGLMKTVKKFGGGDYASIQTAISSLSTSLSTNTCVVIVDTETYNEQITVSGFVGNGWRLRIMKDPALAGSPTISPAVTADAFYIGSSSVTLKGINISQPNAAHALRVEGHFAEILQSTITLNQSAYMGVYFNGASTGTVSQVYVFNQSGDALHFNGGAKLNQVSESSLNAFVTGKAAVYFANSTSNTVTGSYLFSQMGYGANFDMNSFYNAVTYSTVTAVSGTARPVAFSGGWGNWVADSYLWTSAGIGVYFNSTALLNRSMVIGGANSVMFSAGGSTVTYSIVSTNNGTAVNFVSAGNVVSFSTVTTSALGALYALSVNSARNTVSDSYIRNSAGTAIYAPNAGSDFNLRRSTAIGAGTGYALQTYGASNTSITGSYLHNPDGTSVLFTNWGNNNSVSFSTITGGGANSPALYLLQSQNNIVSDCYISGSTAAYASEAAPTQFNNNVIISTWNLGGGLGFGSYGSYTVSSNTISGGPGGAAIDLEKHNSDLVTITSNTINGGSYGLVLPYNWPVVSISSLTFQALLPGATAIHILPGGGLTLNISSVSFNSPNIAVNINAFNVSGTIRVYAPAGPRASQYLANDTLGRIIWPWPDSQTVSGVSGNTIAVSFGTNGALGYEVLASTAADLTGARISTVTAPGPSSLLLEGLRYNTPYTIRAGALWDQTTYYYPAAGGSTTEIETPASVYIDQVGTTAIVASAYAPSPAFTGMDLGISGVAVTTWTIFDTWTENGGRWETRGDLVEGHWSHSGAVIGGKIYVVGGWNGGVGGYYDYNNEYDPVTDIWQSRTPMPTARQVTAVGVIAGKLYVVGGQNDSGSLDVNEEYDPETDSWKTRAPLPTARRGLSAGVLNGRLYAVGGYDASVQKTNANEVYDPVNDSWSARTGLAGARGDLVVAAVNGKLYAMGGYVAGPVATNEEYDPALNDWTPRAAMPTARYRSAAGVIGGKIYVLGGVTSDRVNNNEEYDPSANVWAERAAMPSARQVLAAGVVDGKLYAIGGWDSPTKNEVYDPGVSRKITGLKPNTQYTFKAKARNQYGVETGESATVSTYTLAAVALTPDGHTFDKVYVSSVVVAWSSGTAAGGFNGPNAQYVLQGSTAADFSGTLTVNQGWNPVHMDPLLPNTTYHFRIMAYNVGDFTDNKWLPLGSTVTMVNSPVAMPALAVTTYSVTAAWDANGNPGDTWYTAQISLDSGFSPVLVSSVTRGTSALFSGLPSANNSYYLRVNAINRAGSPTEWVQLGSTATAVEAPAAVYFDEVGSNTITAAAYSAGPAFTGLERGQSGAVVARDGVYSAWRSGGNTWTAKGAMTTARYDLAIGAIGGKLYAVGGTTSGSDYFSTNEEYDPVINAWSAKADMLTARNDMAAGVIGGKLYVVGGGNSVLLATNEAYDPVGNTWSTKASMPTARAALSAGVIGGRLYAVGGYASGGGNYLGANEEYDPETDTWSTKEAMPTVRYTLDIGVISGKLYAVGGSNSSASAANEEYDPANNTWTTKMAMPSARSCISAGAIGGKLFVVGGSDGGNLNANIEYDPLVNAWVTRAAMPTARLKLSLGAVNGKLYALGGYNGSVLAINEEYDPGVASTFTALSPNTQYFFKAKARNLLGVETAESVTVSTWTLADTPQAPQFFEVFSSSFVIAWPPDANPADVTLYRALASTDPAFGVIAASSDTYLMAAALAGLSANTTYYVRVAAINGGGILSEYTALRSTVTPIETPTSVYFDEITSNTIMASAYAPGPAFTGMERAGSGVAITTGTTFDIWGSTGNYWANKAAMTTARQWLAAGAIGGKIYAVGGFNGSYLNKNEEYDPVSNAWTGKADMTTARAYLAAGVIGGKLYAVGGSAGPNLDKNEEYDPVAGNWATKRAMPTARNGLAAAVAGGKLYALGGYDTTYTDENEEYDPETDTWASKRAMLSARNGLAAVAVGEKLYAVGGRNGGSYANQTEEYNPATDTWETKTVMPTARENVAAGTSGGKLYVVGGNNLGYLNKNEEYDPAARTWAEKPSMPTARESMAIAVVGGRLYAVGGYDLASKAQNEVFDPGTARYFSALTPNTQYNFKAKARNQSGTMTGESVTVSTWTLAAKPAAAANPLYDSYANSIWASWLANGNPAGTVYDAQLSTSADFSPVAASSRTVNIFAGIPELVPNTTYYARVAAVNGGGIYSDYLVIGSTLTRIETPVNVYVDEVGTTTIVASAYAYSLTGLERGISGVNITTGSLYGVWGSTGNYWAGKAALSGSRASAASAAIGGKIYIVGGWAGGSPFDYNEEYDPVINNWTTKAVLPTPRRNPAAAAIGGRLYVVGGASGSTALSDNEAYDPVSGTWETKAPMPTARHSLAAGAAGGKLYAMGGAVGAGNLAVNEEYDPAYNRWTAKTDLPTGRSGLGIAAVSGKLYAVGGYGAAGYLTVNEEYDPESGNWETRTSAPTSRAFLGVGAVGGKVYAVGGVDSGNISVNEVYDPAQGTWATMAPLPTARQSFALSAVSGRLYAMGGAYISSNDEYSPGVALPFSGLEPNRLYTFKVKARNQAGTATGEVMAVSTYTLAAVTPPANGQVFSNVFLSSVTVAWSSGTAAGGYNGPGASFKIQAAAAADFSGSVLTYTASDPSEFVKSIEGLGSNTTYYFRIQAANKGGMTDHSWLPLGTTVTHAIVPAAADPAFGGVGYEGLSVYWDANGNSPGTVYKVQYSTAQDFSRIYSTAFPVSGTNAAIGGLAPNTTWYARVAAVSYSGVDTDYYVIGATVTAMETPSNVYFDEVGPTSIVASAYAPGAAFTGLERGYSGVNISTDDFYGLWGSTGNYWSVKAALPIGRMYLAAAAAGGKIYVLGGTTDGSIALNINNEYDPVSGAWATRAPMQSSRMGLAAAAVGGKVYAMGGYNSGYLADNEEYDPETNAWNFKAPISPARFSLGAASVDGKIYAVGGANTGGGLTVNQAYTPSTDVWVSRAAMPAARYDMAVAASGGKIYVIGGAEVSLTYEYDPAQNGWHVKAAIPSRTYLAAAAAGGKIYAIGGSPGNLKLNEKYDPESDTWNTMADLPAGRSQLAAAAAGGRIYTFGGSGGMGVTAVYEPGTALAFDGLAPNKIYAFKAKARSQTGLETAEGPAVSTYTLAAVSLPQSAPAFSGIWLSSMTVNWSSGTSAGGFNGPGASYRVEVSTDADFVPNYGGMSTFNLAETLQGLMSNTTQYFRVQSYNSANVTDHSWVALSSASTLTKQVTGTGFAGVYTTTVTVGWAALPVIQQSDSCEGYLVDASTAPDFTGLVLSSATASPTLGSLTVQNLFADATYYFRVGSLNWNGAANYVSAGSTKTQTETESPAIFSNEPFDYAWYGANTRVYDVDFNDAGGSRLSRFQVKATTAMGQAGLVTADWADVVTGIGADSYVLNWGVGSATWDLLQDGTNYISVRVYDGAGNTGSQDNAFVVFKDTTPPAIAENVDDTVWQKAPGAANGVELADGHSKVRALQYAVWSAPARGGTQLIPWIDIGVDLDTPAYNSNFVVGTSTWTLLASGTNYVSLRAWDYALPPNTTTWADAFVVLKDTSAPAKILDLAGTGITDNFIRLGFTAPAEFPSGLAEYAVHYADYTAAWSTSAVLGSTHVYVSTSGVSAGAAQAIEIPGLGSNTTYYFHTWSRDRAGNWSNDSGPATEVTLAEKPAAGIFALYFSSAAVVWTPVDSRGYVLDASTSSDFIGVLYSSFTAEPSVGGLVVSGLLPNTNYHFRAGSLNWAGAANYFGVGSNSTYAVEPGSAAVFSAVSSGTVTVGWLSNGNGPGTSYRVDVSSDNFAGIVFSSVTPALYSGPITLTFNALSANTTYWFAVKAMGNNGDTTSALVLGSTVTLPVPPIITTYKLWSSSAVIAWDANGNGAGTIYDCDLSTASDLAVPEVSSRTIALTLDLGILSANTTYYMRLRALSAVSQPSDYAQASALSLAAAPSSIGAYSVGPNSVGLYWGTGANPGGLASSDWAASGAMYAGRYGHAAAASGDILLVSGGSDGTGYKSDVWYAPFTASGVPGTWTRTRSLPGARYGHASAALNGRLYVIGGYDGTAARDEVWSAPISSSGSLGAWAAEAALPQPLYAHAAVIVDDRLYVLGGYGSMVSDKVWSTKFNSDGTLTGWSDSGTLPGGRYALAAAVVVSTGSARICVSGGNDGAAARSEVWTAGMDAAGKLIDWKSAPSLPNGLYGHGMVGVFGGIFVAGGNNGSMARAATLRAAVNPDGTLGAWKPQGDLLQAVQSHVMGARYGKLFVIGGYDGAVSKSEIYSAVITGTEYKVTITGSGLPETPWFAANNIEVGSLVPDSYYIFRASARNFDGKEALSAASFSTYTYAAQPSTAVFGGVYISSVQVNWLTNDNHTAVTYRIELSSDAAHTLPAFALSVKGSSVVFEGLDDDYRYYARVRAANNVGIYTAWTDLGSAMTRANPALDFTNPAMTNNQAGDNVWRNSSGVYDIDFNDAGGSYLSRVQVRASASAGGTGPFSPDWTDVVTGINDSSYTADFSLGASTFSLLQPGTNYISVRVFDGNFNSSETVDAFYILKDTAAPVIYDPQNGETAWRMDDAGAVYDVDFADDVSGLAGIEYSASPNQGSGDAAALGWTPIAALSTGPASYNADWGVAFAALANDATNYISVRAWDLAGNTVTVSGIDVFKILKFVSGPEVAITAPDTAYRSAIPAITGTASDARSHDLAGTELNLLDVTSGKYWNGADFLAPAPVWLAVSTAASWSYAPAITWSEGAQYQAVARSSDTAANYSVTYATRVFTFDSAAPGLALLAPADGATVNSFAAVSGTAFDASGLSAMGIKLKRVSDGKWWDFTAGAWTVSGSSAAVAGAAGWSYAPAELLKASLETMASYYYTLYAADNSYPANAAQFEVFGATFSFLDDTAPAAITDLRASTGSAPGNISLAWSAPGDDGAAGMTLSGRYKIQYSTQPDVVFSTADAQAEEVFTAVSAGSARSKELVFLVPGETYYLRAWTQDDAGNWSALSNGATTQAALYPDRISGHVMKVSSEGITGVLVEAFDIVGTLRASAFTVPDGSGTYVLAPLPSGSYRVQATWTADDIISSVGSDGIALGVSDADFTLAINCELASIGGELAVYRLSARGRSPQGVRPAAAGVELYQRNRLVATVPVDAAGKFLIKNLLPGKYILKVPDANGGAKELSVTLKAGQALVINPLGELLKNARVYTYPNPARKMVKFHIESDQPSLTKRITVLDITGRAIKVINDSDFGTGAGTWEYTWNIPSKVASGVYIYVVRVKFEATGESKKTIKKFAIVR